MNDLPTAAREVLVEFQQAAGWEQRARLLMQWGDRLEPVDEDERNETNLVSGCESRVWLIGDRPGHHWHFRATSEARLLRGLLAVLLARVNGLDSYQLLQLDVTHWFEQLGLSRQLSPSRSNGMNAVLERMHHISQHAG
ncbi:SufE family protein [Stutzerimonas stutzeri]|uniref:SufE family protein n=1 Tax=Stutzerimonas stutzeri TaxID=316 RepID=UPI0015E3A8E8|nr:SufE family protein [Stutzerimonas stutzeri]MBA1261780.1 SufE family protein [Stutzerimonas stutzeri]